jgi:lysophospholipid acyltransferase (LPLAT)-like uncharacterized protein
MLKNKLRGLLLAGLVWIIYRTLWLTWKVEIIEPESLKKKLKEKDPVIFSHWHGDEIVLLQLAGSYRIATITSTSKDGEMMDRLFHFMGGETSRGSSTRGAVQALKGLIRLVKSGWNCSFAVDGPKGPIYKVKPGVFEVAKLLRAPIYTAGVACDRAIHFPKSWNKTYLPKPFAKIIIAWTGPWPPLSKEEDPRDPERAKFLETELNNAKQQAFNIIAAN